MSSRAATGRRVLVALGAVLLVLGIFDFAHENRIHYTNDWPVDYDINWVAARRLLDRQPLYDRDAARAEGVRLLGRDMHKTGRSAFSSYIGSPPVALTHVPFLALDHDTGARLFRMLSFVEMIGALLLTAWALSPPARAPAALFGLAAFFWGFPMVKSLSLGQGTGLVALSLAAGIWAASRERWGLAGVGLGVATVLKISPVLLVVYLLLRGKRRAVSSAALSAGALLGVATLVGRPSDLLTWVRDVSPVASKGAISAYNQSIVGAGARLMTSGPDLASHAGPGAWYLLAYVVWSVALWALWRYRRGRTVEPLELGVLVLVILLAGPLTWDHYFVWALIPLVLIVDPARWRGRRPVEVVVLVAVLVGATWMCKAGIPMPSPAAVRNDWWERVRTVRYVASAAGYLFVAVWLLVRSPARRRSAPECDRARRVALGATRGLVAAGVHQRGGS
jgi:alpha-1,2-mannosyltransferase